VVLNLASSIQLLRQYFFKAAMNRLFRPQYITALMEQFKSKMKLVISEIPWRRSVVPWKRLIAETITSGVAHTIKDDTAIIKFIVVLFFPFRMRTSFRRYIMRELNVTKHNTGTINLTV
jgi:hypothetical protein